LAGRNAYFAARAEFVSALRLIAEGLDAEQSTNTHSHALTAAMTAMKESEDFLPGGSGLEADRDLQELIAIHTTPILKNDAVRATSMTALRSYLTFAQEQFSFAAGREVSGSMALHALGKLHSALAQKKNALVVAPEPKAMMFYQAALLVYPKNYMAANDLGVLLAQCGRYASARAMLEYSVSLCPKSTNWRNLAIACQQQGQTTLANRAIRQAERTRQIELAQRKKTTATVSEIVQWVDPQTLAQTSTNPPAIGATPSHTAGQNRTGPVSRSAITTNSQNSPTVMAPSPSNDKEPAPTPAAASRRTWNATAY
jgi:tetratricopeptide (TPR) repeat protein